MFTKIYYGPDPEPLDLVSTFTSCFSKRSFNIIFPSTLRFLVMGFLDPCMLHALPV